MIIGHSDMDVESVLDIILGVENYIQYSHTQRSLGRRVAHDHRWPRETRENLTDETIDS